MTDAADNGNGRVTLAVIGTKLDSLTDTVNGWHTDQEQRLRTIESWCETSRERWRTHEREHGTERGVMAGVGTLITGVLTYLQLGPK